MDLAVQVFTGLPGGPGIDQPALRRRLERITEATAITVAMIGWNPAAWPAAVADWLRDQGTAVYLWLPVFSGWDDLSPLVGPSGRPVAQPYRSAQGERFDFGCPANPDNVERIIERFDADYAGPVYDGVFLDKIRFPSFIDGLAPIQTCFCPHCAARFGPDRAARLDQGDNPLGLLPYQGPGWHSADDGVTRLFAAKASAVTGSVTVLAQALRARGLRVGLDLFAPFLAWFVGQDYRALAPLADFIKPMFYRRTQAPAGLPFELDRYAAAFGGSGADIACRRARLLELCGTSAPDLGFINRELAVIGRAVKVYAGFEANRTEVAPTTPAYVAENVTGLEADGLALSWDLNSTPADNLRAVLDALSSL